MDGCELTLEGCEFALEARELTLDPFKLEKKSCSTQRKDFKRGVPDQER